MPLLQKLDLAYEYSWTVINGDNPRVTGKPDSTLLNRSEGYEVLPFINRFADKHKFKEKSLGLKTEWLIKEHLPSNLRSHAHVEKWLEDNWNEYSESDDYDPDLDPDLW